MQGLTIKTDSVFNFAILQVSIKIAIKDQYAAKIAYFSRKIN
jgi:hypothetical protein